MRRRALGDLKQWYNKLDRMPLVLRGARQVGKSTLIELFCQHENLELVKINLELQKLKSAESENFILQELIDEIQLKTKKKFTEKSLLFFDEIQEQPRLLSLLRYFYELRPDMAIVAAGSLLEISLKNEKYSFPVGRVEFYHLGPMTFTEYLWATENEFLSQKIEVGDFTSSVIQLAKEELRKYYYIGGMPKAIKTYVEEGSLVSVREIQEQIIQTYIADFPKYNKRIQTERINRIFSACALQLGKKIIYQKLDSHSQSRDVRRIVELLVDARVLLPCTHTNANSIPLAGESDTNIQKLYFLDIGLINALMRLDLEAINSEFDNNFNTKGMLAEQFVAQHLAYIEGNKNPPSLHYWLRDKGTQKGEIDFVIQYKNKVIPIEVKSVSSGHLKSLFYFVKEKGAKQAIKISLDDYSNKNVSHKISQEDFETHLINIPHYAVEHILNFLKT